MTSTCFLILLALATGAAAVIFGVCCCVVLRENARLQRIQWSRVKTSIRLRQLRKIQQQLEEYVNADEGEDVTTQHWSMQ